MSKLIFLLIGVIIAIPIACCCGSTAVQSLSNTPQVFPTAELIQATTSPEESAWYACVDFVEKQLGVSMFDAQEYNPSGVTLLSADRFQVDVYYASKNVIYRCTIDHLGGQWILSKLQVK